MPSKQIPASASLQRLPRYLAYLRVRQKQGITAVSSTTIAEDLRLNPVQVRKDLALATKAGRPRTGYPLATLIDDLESFLGYRNTSDAFLIGTGQLGRALLGYTQFADYGLTILAGFDINPVLHGQEIYSKPIFPMEKLGNLVSRMGVRIAILTVPSAVARDVCEIAVESGIRAIWNFTSVHLDVPEHILVRSEDLAASFAILSNQLASTIQEEQGGYHT